MRHLRSVNHMMVLFFAVAILFPPLAATAADGTIVQNDLDRLQGRLEEHGWKVERSPSGDLLLWPPGQDTRGRPVQVKTVDDGRIPATDLQSLQQALKEKGWRVEKDAKGDLLVYPADGSAAEVTAATVEQESDRLVDLQALLAASGWRVEKRAQGDLVLYPAPSPVAATSQTRTLDIEQTDLVAVKSALDRAGWRTERREDGSLILYPRSDRSSEAVSAPADPVSTGRVKLPVDNWKEARLLANYWIGQQADKNLSPGKIRKVNWIYLVSIVDKSPPYRLKNQLAIRSRDGRVVPLF